MSTTKDVKDTLIMQIFELEALQSMYPKEISVFDQGNLADINDFIDGKQTKIPPRLQYDIKITLAEGNVDLVVNLPLDYPHVDPEVYCRSSDLDRERRMNLNKALSIFVESQDKGEPIIYTLISWIQDNAEIYLTKLIMNENTTELKDSSCKSHINFSRYWIYSHHIYSKTKRKNILELAKNCSLSGFCLIGKPGIICVEGALDECEYFWQEVKSMNWHRIIVKFLEKDFDFIDNLNVYKKFCDFQEICFPTSERHNNMGQLLKYLIEHNVEYAFKELFGIEAKNS